MLKHKIKNCLSDILYLEFIVSLKKVYKIKDRKVILKKKLNALSSNFCKKELWDLLIQGHNLLIFALVLEIGTYMQNLN